jgi:hypothetical protein
MKPIPWYSVGNNMIISIRSNGTCHSSSHTFAKRHHCTKFHTAAAATTHHRRLPHRPRRIPTTTTTITGDLIPRSCTAVVWTHQKMNRPVCARRPCQHPPPDTITWTSRHSSSSIPSHRLKRAVTISIRNHLPNRTIRTNRWTNIMTMKVGWNIRNTNPWTLSKILPSTLSPTIIIITFGSNIISKFTTRIIIPSS